MQRVLTQQLTAASRFRNEYDQVNETISAQRNIFHQMDVEYHKWRRFQTAMDIVTQFRIKWLSWRVKVGEDAFMSVWKILEQLAWGIGAILHEEERTARIRSEMPNILDVARDIIRSKQDEALKSAESDALRLKAIETHAKAEVESRTEELTLPYQWISPIVWKIYQSVHQSQTASPALRQTMQQLIEITIDANPYMYLQTVYRPPPPHLGACWEIRQSERLEKITAVLLPYFQQLHEDAFWLDYHRSPKEIADDPRKFWRKCWRRFHGIIRCTRRLAVHFHFVILFMYSVAMGRDDPDVTVDTIAAQAEACTSQFDVLYGLSLSSADSKDRLIKETYEFAPEVLVLMDQWRHENEVIEYGFAPNYRPIDFAVRFGGSWKNGRNNRDVLKKISLCLRELLPAWQRTHLGKPYFQKLTIGSIGDLEEKVKTSLGAVTNLVHQIYFARWMARRNPPYWKNWWATLELRTHDTTTTEDPKMVYDDDSNSVKKLEQYHSAQTIVAQNHDVVEETTLVENHSSQCEEFSENDIKSNIPQDDAIEEVEVSINEDKEDLVPTVENVPEVKEYLDRKSVDVSRFRAPAPMKFCLQDAKRKSTKQMPSTNSSKTEEKKLTTLVEVRPRRKASGVILLKDIYRWTDEEIDDYEQEMERIYQVQTSLLGLCEKISLQKMLIEKEKQHQNATMLWKDHVFKALILADACVKLRELAAEIVDFSEEIAMHGAADALIQRPALRVLPPVPSLGLRVQYSVSSLQEIVQTSQEEVKRKLQDSDALCSLPYQELLAFFGCANKLLLSIVANNQQHADPQVEPNVMTLQLTETARHKDVEMAESTTQTQSSVSRAI